MVNKARLYWSLQIGGWLIYALLQIGFSTVAATQESVSIRRIVFFAGEALLCLLVTHGLRHLLIRWGWVGMSMRQVVPRVLAAVIILGFLIYFLRLPLSLVLGTPYDPSVVLAPDQILGLSSFYVFLMFVWVLFYMSYHYVEQHNRSLKAEALVASIELNNLKTQLNPHLIFNALNNIRALVEENPQKAKEAINQLSNILRSSLAFDKKELTKFDDELKIVHDYLGLESIRFEERLRTTFHIHPGSYRFMVPPFMIQTLVENGIKHGISRSKEGGLVEIATTVTANKMRIIIRNTGHLLNGSQRRHQGVGLKNTIQRLKLLYGGGASLRIMNEKDNFVRAEVTIPRIK